MEAESNQLLQQLQTLSKELLYPSESDYPLEFFDASQLFQERTVSTILQELGLDEQTKVVEQDVEAFFKPVTTIQDWFEEEEKTQVQAFGELKSLLELHSSDIQIFKIGETEVQVYLMAIVNAIDVIGMKTTVIES
jgi:Nuclease A inhibitor-like protein